MITKRWLIFIFMMILIVPLLPLSSEVSNAQGNEGLVAKTYCEAEVKFNYLTNFRRGPSANNGVKRQLDWNHEEIRIFGRDEEGLWYQGFLTEPEMVGWLWWENINLFGNCNELPVTADDAEPVAPPAAPANVELPEFAQHLELNELDTAYYLNEGMIYIRRTNTDPLQQSHMIIADLANDNLEVGVHVGAVPNTNATLVSDMVKETGAFVAINGDFYGGNYMPQGLTVIDGQVITAPQFRSTFAITEDKEPYFGYFTEGWTWDASIQTLGDGWTPLQWLNIPCDPGWLCLYNDAIGGLPGRDGFWGYRVLLSPELEVLEIAPASGYMEIPEDHYVLLGGQYTEKGRWIEEWLDVGDTITLNLTTNPPWQDFEHAISGGPLFIEDGEFRQDCDPSVDEEERECEAFDENFRLSHYFDVSIPRSSVGYDEDNNLLFLVVVEGYEVDHSEGMTQLALAELYFEYGADWAMEFDGGGSSGLWVDNSFVNDFPRAERRLSNALMLYWNE